MAKGANTIADRIRHWIGIARYTIRLVLEQQPSRLYTWFTLPLLVLVTISNARNTTAIMHQNSLAIAALK